MIGFGQHHSGVTAVWPRACALAEGDRFVLACRAMDFVDELGGGGADGFGRVLRAGGTLFWGLRSGMFCRGP